MKQRLLLLIAASLACSTAWAYDFSAVAPTGQTLYYNITGSNEVAVTSQNVAYPFYSTYPTGDLTIPDTVSYDGTTYTVTSIGNYAFFGCSGLTSVTIPEGVTSIGNHAFCNCSGLTSVTIPDGVTSISNSAFSGCSGLTSVTIPDGVTSIGEYAFLGCSGLTSVTIPEGVTSISGHAFSGCSGLTSVSIPEGVTSIGYHAFYSCSGLTTITIGSGVTYMDDYAFHGCSSLTKTNYTGTVAQWCGIKFDYYDSNPVSYSHNLFINDVEIKDLVIPDSVTSIGNYAFYNCSGIKDLVIPDSVTSIGNYAFYNCSGITEINSMAKVAPTIGNKSFDGVPSTIPVNIPCGSQMSYYSRWPYFSNFMEDDGFIFSAQSADTSMGTVEVLTAPTCQAPQAVVYATAHTGFLFDHWSDGNNDNPRSLTLTSDSSLTAYFATMVYDTVFVHDTTYIDVHDTTYIDVHDTTYINVHDTTCINVHDTTYINVHDTTYINVHDTTYINVHDTTYINVHDTTYIDVHDTTYIMQVDTLIITLYDTLTLTVYDTVDNYIFDTVDNYIYDTIDNYIYDTVDHYIYDTVDHYIYDTVDNYIFDTVDNYIYDTVTLTDTLWLTDTVYIHDTIYITDEAVGDVTVPLAKVYSSQGQIVVEGAEGCEVTLYDDVGRRMAARRDDFAMLRFDVPASGAYLVKVGHAPARRVVVIK